MEWKIGEIFEYNGEWYQCVECDSCGECALFTTECGSGTKSELADEMFGECSKIRRSDNKHVIFKKLERVGEPYRRWLSPLNSIMVQRYRLYGRNVIMPDEPYMYFNAIDNTIEIEIKENKEDMEDLDKIKVRDYTKVEELNVMEEKKLNLKPFDIQKAREGKPVCTRDGHKARIICFDYNGETGDYPIVALVHYNKGSKCYERVLKYTSDGLFNKYGDFQHNDDLMMLPEKRSGWAKVRKDINLYDTKEEADRKMIGNNEYVTAKVCWEE